MDPSWNGQGFNVTFPARYGHKTLLSICPSTFNMPTVMQSFAGLPIDALEEAKAMGWNEALQQPISQDGLDLKANIQLLDFEWCVAAPPPTSKVAVTMDVDNMSLPSFQMVTKPLVISTASGPVTTTINPPKLASIPLLLAKL